MRLLWYVILLAVPAGILHAELKINVPVSTNQKQGHPSDSASGGEKSRKKTPHTSGNVLRFRNGDILHGKFLSISDKGQLEWQYPGVKEHILFGLPMLKSITFLSGGRPENRPESVIVLSNGDRLPGKLLSIDSDSLKLATEYAAELNIHRYMVKDIFFNPYAGNLYYGPKSEKEWAPPKNYRLKGTVKVADSILTITPQALAAAKAGKADKMKISFDVLNPSAKMNFRFYFLSNKHLFSDEYEPDAYYLDISGISCVLGRETEDDGEDSMSRFTFPSDYLGAPLRITVYVDKPALKFGAAVNAKRCRMVKDEYDEFAGGGGYIAFRNRGAVPVSITNISASEWDDGEKADGTGKGVTNNMIYFTNGDKATGKLIGASDGNLVFKTDYAEMKIPFTRVYQISCPKEILRRTRRRKEDVQIYLVDTGRITAGLTSSTGKHLQGVSENFGKVSIHIPFIRQIRFNIYEEDVKGQDVLLNHQQGADGSNPAVQCILRK